MADGRLISCALTTKSVEDHSKTVTRRWGWEFVKVGEILRPVDKSPRDGKPYRVLAVVEVVKVDIVRSKTYGVSARWLVKRSLAPFLSDWPAEAAREGLPKLTVDEFTDLLISAAPKAPLRMLTRIEWKYLS